MGKRFGRDEEKSPEELFDLLARWTADIPGREVATTGIVDPDHWEVKGLFHESPYVEQMPRLAHATTRLRDISRNRVTHVYQWWAPALYLKPEELAAVFYGIELDPLLRKRGVKEGLATIRESFGARHLRPGDVPLLELPEDEKVLEVWREYLDSQDHLVLLLRELLTDDQTTGHTRSIVGLEREGRMEW